MTAYLLASRFVGQVLEVPGEEDHPFIVWAHSLAGLGRHSPDEVPWCSSFLVAIAWLLRLPNPGSARAREWLLVGQPIQLSSAMVGFDVVVLKRGSGPQPPASVIRAPGHVGFFAGLEGDQVKVLGGNQGNRVSIANFPVASVLGVRRLA